MPDPVTIGALAASALAMRDVHGRIDHHELGVSLHEVGYCLSSTGQFTKARPWYERAVAAKEKVTFTDASITKASHELVEQCALCRYRHNVHYAEVWIMPHGVMNAR